MRPAFCWALPALSALPWAGAQSSTESLLATMPQCGLQCLVSAIASSTCAATNTTCVCANEAINTNTTACVALSCSVQDSLATKNVSNTICQVPVRDKSASYANISITLAVISNFLVILRFSYKLFTRQDLWWDDYTVLVLIFAGIPSVVITTHGTTKNGLGQDVWTLTSSQITNFVYFFYIMEILYFLQLTLLKLTLLFFFLRIFPATAVKRTIWGTVAFVIFWGMLFVLLAIFQCSPISYYWTNWDGLHEGKCLNVNGIGWANAAISIALDIWMLAIPFWQVKSLKIHWKKKIGVFMMFFVGTFITIVSILRLQTLLSFANSQNPTWDNLMVSIWSTVEVNVGIFCVCMPVLRLILVRAIPVLGSGAHNSRYGSGSRLKSNHSSHGRSRGRSNPMPLDGAGPAHEPKGIMYQQSYSVQHSDETDEARLVHMRNLEPQGNKSQAKSEVSV